jgi:hypothetical protein
MLTGALITTEFLIEGIKNSDHWKSIGDASLASFKEKLLGIYRQFPAEALPIESTTERDLIDKVILALGWDDFLTQQTATPKGRADVPDYLLFESAEKKEAANNEPKQADRFKHGLAIMEAKAWQTPLDRGGGAGWGVPSNQILRYLHIVDIQANGAIKWGVLTNGRQWRLYYQDAKSRSEEFLSLDLPLILGLPGFEKDLFSAELAQRQDWLKVFYAFFSKTAFIKGGPQNISFHQFAVAEGRFWEAKVAEDLSGVVFSSVLPEFAKALMDNDQARPQALDPAYMAELREATLIFLYRLLFILYAEDRDLLPATDEKYDDYGIRKRVRDDIRRRIDAGDDTFSGAISNYYRHIGDLCRAIDKGDQSIGLPPYNGGLFDERRAPLLSRSSIPDAIFAPLFDKLSRHHDGEKKSWINYRDLSVQQLGSIYERFLEYELAAEEGGGISIRPNIFSRKTSGSYYTPDSLVSLIIKSSADPLIDERMEEFRQKAGELKAKKGPKAERLKELAGSDPAMALLQIKALDPAMGSGHFLVSLVDYLADRMLILMEETERIADWADEKNPYHSPLAGSIAEIRKHILAETQAHKWIVRADQLDDRQLVRRMILKKCVFGVDKNPMAVELAKVSLWLHTFTVGAPLSFLDHHLRLGDSLFGEFTCDVENMLRQRGSMFINNEVNKAKATAKGMARIESLTDSDIAEVRESASIYQEVSQGRRPLTRFFDIVHALRWIDTSDKERQKAVNAFFDQTFGDPVSMVAEDKLPEKPQSGKVNGDYDRLVSILREAREIADEERFMHWEVAFPVVWENWEVPKPEGGFDIVLGNPPWDRMKLQEVEWFSSRSPQIAYATRAADRKKLIKKLRDNNDPLVQEYEKAGQRAKMATEVARDIGHYPLLSGGDVNLYSLFVERAHKLIQPKGMVGLLVPSGIVSDLTASKFFKYIAGAGRLAHLYDFENKKAFFPDVHSRFKLSVYIAGGEKKKFRKAKMAFFLHNVRELEEPDRVFTMGPADFARVNPNTGTAPIFRTKRDAEITRRVYSKFPILRREGEEPVWPVKYMRMFDMTNDSHLFKTKEELDKEGFYPVAWHKMKRGKEECVPLYEGKMVQAYDHRAASVVVNPANLMRPAQPAPTTPEKYKNPKWFPAPQFWVSREKLPDAFPLKWFMGFKDVTAPTNMRSMIAAILPLAGLGNTLPALLPDDGKKEFRKVAPLIIANLNSFVFDFIARQKIHGQHLNWFIVEQIPVIPPEKFEGKIGKKKIAGLVCDHVLRLTYTAEDMKPFAEDVGYNGKPFIWDEDERRHLRARLDALFFLLYEISREDADYILSTFPIVREGDEKAHGRYITRDLILAYMNALSAGDAESDITL